MADLDSKALAATGAGPNREQSSRTSRSLGSRERLMATIAMRNLLWDLDFLPDAPANCVSSHEAAELTVDFLCAHCRCHPIHPMLMQRPKQMQGFSFSAGHGRGSNDGTDWQRPIWRNV